MASTRFLFKGSVANAATQYVGVPVRADGVITAQIAWLDATSAATITLEVTNYDPAEAPVSTAGSAWIWKDTSEAITGPAATAAGSTLVNATGFYQSRARFKIVATADCAFEITE